LQGDAFWRKWELLYLSGKLFDWDNVRGQILALETEYTSLYGDFR